MNAVQCKLARVALGWGVRDLAQAANVSTQTISRLEKGEDLRAATLEGIKRVLEEAGIEFIPESDDGYGIRIKKPQPPNSSTN
ncbi:MULTISPECIES: helix-turn-helix domain-containing protein [Rhizobium/Agrobacterium group]|uniref:Helix-turn-helix domain-containing protein n=1 Tax=Agrobacterium vitis TaxID=373 RepID=A0ABD6HEF8_AGRVI|nr:MULTISPECIES: helix-turn-helix transcriptional regulator [Rhizobium/Agrobacterium group]MUO28273.1 helix-turn-helix domain-containing protein [Agrobacterium vitis]MUO40693.1 helix-turn-helix domain-containing protein [Agrobacterium vitis]MUP12768.1 helix-turn-helix domain-containing protein [Agrobacterium vitis]